VRIRLGSLERYVLTRNLIAVGGAFAIIASIVLLIDFVELSRSYGGREEISFFTVLAFTFMKSPSVILQLLPFVFLFGTVAAYISLNRHSELVAMRAAGISAWRFIFPAAGMALVIGLLTVAVFNPVASALDGQFEQARTENSTDPAARPKRIWLRQGDARTQVIIGAGGKDTSDGVLLKDVSLFVYAVGPDGSPVFTRRIEAAQARLIKGYWRLKEAREATPGTAAARYDSLLIPSPLSDRTALERFASAQSISFWRLPGAIGRIEAAGFSALNYRLRLDQLLALPLLLAAMSVLAASFSLKLIRLGGLAALSGTGVAVGFAFFFFDQLCGSLGKAEVIPAFAAAWAPPILALLSGFTLLTYTEDG
jgi:lipopolysaccharide export system permease protein